MINEKEDKIYQIEEKYRDCGSIEDEEDQFVRWINKPLDAGIRNIGGIRNITRVLDDKIEFLFFVSKTGIASGSENPWEDQIDLEAGRIKYWGDAKVSDEKTFDEFRGNKWVKRVYTEYYAKDKRKEAPPILVFEKPESGYVEFKGLCIINDLKIERFKQKGKIVPNYLIDLSILNTDEVRVEWIHDRVKNNTDRKAPEVWKKWVDQGVVDKYHVWMNEIREPSSQKPEGEYKKLIDQINQKLSGKQLEYVVREALRNLNGFDNVAVTPHSGDRGVDLTGEIQLFDELELPEVNPIVKFKCQIKNYEISNGISGKDVSRLASRINEGEIGFFITTSYFTKSAQEETQSSYPVKLIPGKELAKILARSPLTEDYALNEKVIERVKKKTR